VSGWVTRDLAAPHELSVSASVAGGPEFRGFSDGLSRAAVQPFSFFTPCTSGGGVAQPCLSPEASEQTAFLEETATQSFTPLVTGCPAEGTCPSAVAEHANVPAGTVFGGRQEGSNGEECVAGDYCGPIFVAGTPDFSHIVLESDLGLTAGAGANGGLYEASAGKLSYIGAGEGEGGSGNTSNRGAFAGHGAHGISADGSRVIFHGKGEGPKGEPLEGLLMRDTVRGETVRLGEGDFQDASADDSRVFFDAGWDGELDVWQLTSSPGEPLAGTVTDLTEGRGMRGLVLGASEDGSYVYFVSEGVLPASGATVPGENLYVDHYDGTTWQPTFITALSSEDYHDWDEKSEWAHAYLEYQPARVSPDGRWLAFMSQASLTGYDNRDARNGVPDAEVYLYHAEAGGARSLTCASCEPSGARPTGAEYTTISEVPGLAGSFRSWRGNGFVAGNVPGWDFAVESPLGFSYQPRFLSDGGRLFFDSGDGLVPRDVNGTEDVYEFEPEGTPAGAGACSPLSGSGSVVFRVAHAFEAGGVSGVEAAGCVGLISSGVSGEESAFLDASEGGGDVFFLTSAQLSLADQDTAYDVYDAHECTSGSPCLAPATAPPAPCGGEASCRSAAAAAPAIYGASLTQTLSGPEELRVQRLDRALKVCRRDKRRRRRVACEKLARKRYAAKKASARKSSRAGNARGNRGAGS
jgi:hypothetical protein